MSTPHFRNLAPSFVARPRNIRDRAPRAAVLHSNTGLAFALAVAAAALAGYVATLLMVG